MGLDIALGVYVHQVAARIGVPAEAVAYEVTDTATAYLGLSERLPRLPGRDLMLVWDERLGWYVGTEPRGDDRPSVVGYLGGHVVPTPAEVARFVTDVVAGLPPDRLRVFPPLLDRPAMAACMAARPA
ncbi:DUF6292 family protein [Actinokineospora enzanensis]|uniref:DUF6292 family protein n=1 Tax=Actinokineospora enzanensis TaxID=155975 RepID=UPI0003764E22|nr:DUF6292 family protein [Actinokineospora enzanensis]